MLKTTMNSKFILSGGSWGISVYQSSRQMNRTLDVFTLEQMGSNAANTSLVTLTYNIDL